MWVRLRKNKAQAITEYAVLLGIIVLAIVLIQVYLKRSIQGKFKSTADDIGEQFTTGERYTVQTVQQSARQERSGNGTIADLNNTWSSSVIQNAANGSIANITNDINALANVPNIAMGVYAGHEITQTDFVNATAGTGVLGRHSSFSSGKLSGANAATLATEGD